MLACAKGVKDSGQFLLRNGREQHETIITVLYKGKPQHQSVMYEPGVSTSFTVNGSETGQTTMPTVSCHALRQRQWMQHAVHTWAARPGSVMSVCMRAAQFEFCLTVFKLFAASRGRSCSAWCTHLLIMIRSMSIERESSAHC